MEALNTGVGTALVHAHVDTLEHAFTCLHSCNMGMHTYRRTRERRRLGPPRKGAVVPIHVEWRPEMWHWLCACVSGVGRSLFNKFKFFRAPEIFSFFLDSLL